MPNENSHLLPGKLGSGPRQGRWRRISPVIVPALVLVVGLSLSGWLFWSLRKASEDSDRVHFEQLLREAQSDIQRRISIYTNAMRAGQAMYNATPEMTAARWRIFVDTLDLSANYRGIKGMGVVSIVPASKLNAFVATMQAEGRADFALKTKKEAAADTGPVPERSLYITTYIEPENVNDLSKLGFDISEEGNRLQAVERARDSGVPVLTRRVDLAYEGEVRSGMVLYAPLYDPGMPTGSIVQRRRAIRGWLYLPLITEEFFASVMNKGSQELELHFYEGAKPYGENLLYTTDGARNHTGVYERVNPLELVGNRFTLGWSRSRLFHAAAKETPIWGGVFSSIVAVLLAALVAILMKSRQQARDALARQDIELAYQTFALDQHALVAVTDAAGTISYANDKLCALSGYSREELVGQNHRILKSGVHPAGFFKEMYAAISLGKVWQGEICNRNKNGSLSWLSATIVPFPGPDGRPLKYVAIRNDITALKLAEEQIRHSQERFASIFEALDEGILLQERSARVLEFNASAERVLGLTRSQIDGSEPLPSWWQMLDAEGRPMALDNRPTEISFRTGRPLRGTIMGLRREDGSITWLSVNNEPVFDDLGGVRAVVSSFFDITEQRLAENAVRETARRLDLAAGIAGLGIWDWNLADDRMLANDRAFEMYGLPLTSDGCMPFDAWRRIVLPEDLPDQIQALSHTIKTCGQGRRKFRIRRQSDGALRYIESQEQVQTNLAGHAVRVVGVNRDITDSLLAEEALQESETRTRLFAEHAPASVAMFDREMHYLVVSKQWLSDYKLTDQDIIGRSHYDVFPDMPMHWKEIHRRCLSGAVETSLAEPFPRSDGSVQWLQWEVRPWHAPDGSIGGIVMFTLDITKRRELEASLEKARDDALAASRLKSEFLATMSHEIRTPMNGVIGMATLLSQSPLESRQHDMAMALVNSAERLLVIINDILDFSKIEAGKMRIEPVDFNLRDVIEETAALLAATAHRKGLHLICDIDPALATGFLGDSGRIQQVLNNLIGNAIKFTPKGEISIKAAPLRITDKICTLRITITDTGIGIPEAARAHLFQPFVQADGSTTRRFGGTGLGLAICGQLVALMGGNIGFQSEEGKGSSFWIELGLPRVDLPKMDVLDKIPLEARVLVVDDHEVNRMVLTRQLATLEVTSDAAINATQAVQMLTQAAEAGRPYNIALIDLSMPDIDGLSLAKTIRETEKIANTCLILLSSTSETIDPGLASGLKLHAVLSKPVRDTQLRRCLLRVYGRRSTPTPFQRRQVLGGRGLKLLLAEDNETNQFVAQLTLEQLGHSIDIAQTGREALKRLALEPYDAVLMDCQMPEMDGYEATRQIRAGKVKGLNPHIPIIALTAYAMPSDRVHVLEAGMDDFVAKPLSKEALHAALARCGLVEAPQKSAGTVQKFQDRAPVDAEQVFDPAQRNKLQALRSPKGGTVWDKALDIFCKEMPGRLAALDANVRERRAEALGIVAHTIAGSAASLGAPALRAVGLSLETAAREGDWETISRLQEAMLNAWTLLQPELTKTDKP